ncbi:MAG TPA: alpha/beta fold hydrolase [Polyangiaceae bacterium]
MSEFAVQFGPERGLAGIVTEPRHGVPRAALVLVSAGLLAKCGPFRLYAELARRLASEAIVTLRFDLSGVGDSARSPSGLSLRARTELEIGAAVDLVVERYGMPRVALGGLCSGAEDSLRSAASDARIGRVVMIDPFAYRTPGWFVRHALHRGARRTLRALGLYEPLRGAEAPERPRAVSYRYMEREEAAEALGKLFARDGRAHFVYTAGVRERFNHPGQLNAWFPGLELAGRVTVDHFPRIDHTQLLSEDRRAVIEAVADKLTSSAMP